CPQEGLNLFHRGVSSSKLLLNQVHPFMFFNSYSVRESVEVDEDWKRLIRFFWSTSRTALSILEYDSVKLELGFGTAGSVKLIDSPSLRASSGSGNFNFPRTESYLIVLMNEMCLLGSELCFERKPAPPSLDYIPVLSGYPLDSDDDSSDEDLSEIAESLHTQTALALVFHPPSTRPLPTSHAFACRPRKEISIPLGSKAAMDRWRAAPPFICHPLLPSEIPSSSSSPPSLLPSLSLPPPSLLPSLSRKRSRSPSASLPLLVSPSPLSSPPPVAVPPPPEHIESVGDDIETLRASLASAMHETMTLHARIRLLEQHDVVTQEYVE
nr:hypothetical protein [Tanacetum cinerariifolium]